MNCPGRKGISMLKWNLPLIVLHFTAKREADKSSVCSMPEIMELFPDEKLKHIKEKGEMNGVHPCFTFYTALLSAAQIS